MSVPLAAHALARSIDARLLHSILWRHVLPALRPAIPVPFVCEQVHRLPIQLSELAVRERELVTSLIILTRGR